MHRSLSEIVLSLNLDFPVAEIATKTGYSKGNVSTYLKSGRPSTPFLKKLCEEFGLDYEEIKYEIRRSNSIELINQDKNEEESPAEKDIETTPKQKHILIRESLNTGHMQPIESNKKVAAGNIVFFDDEPNIILEPITASYLEEAPVTVQVVGESMHPTIKSGDRVALKRLMNKQMINPGEIYFLIDTNNEKFAKRVYTINGELDRIVLRSDNSEKDGKGNFIYPDFERHWKDIIAVYKVKADISLH